MTIPTAANTDRPRAKGYDVDIGGNYYRLAPTPQYPIIRRTAEPVPGRVATEVNPEDMGEEISRTFSRVDFTGGSGLEFAHERGSSELDATRFWDSFSVDSSREGGEIRESLKLHKKIREVGPTAGSKTVDMMIVGQDIGRVWLSRNTDGVFYTDDIEDSTPTWTQETGVLTVDAATFVRFLAADGQELYAATDHGVHKRDGGGTWTHWSDRTVAEIWKAKRRIIGTASAFIYELASGAGSTLLHTLSSGMEVVQIIEGGPWIFIAARNLQRNESELLIFKDESGTLTIQAEIYFPNESFGGIAYSYGQLLYTMSIESISMGEAEARLWRAEVTGDNWLTNAQLVKTFRFDNNRLWRTSNIAISGEYAYFMLAHSDSPSLDGDLHLWRYDFATGGIAKDFTWDPSGITASTVNHPDGVAISGDRKPLMLNAVEAKVGLEDLTDYEAEGWIMSPLIDFYTDRDKTWLGITVNTANLDGDTGSVKVYYTTNPDALEDDSSTDWTLADTIDTTAESGVELKLSDVSSRWLAVMLKLYPSTDSETTPEVFSFSVRAYVGTNNVEYIFPVNVSDQIERPNRQRLRVKGNGNAVWDSLKAMEGEQQDIEIFRPNETATAVVKRVSYPIEVPADRGTSLRIALVEAEGYET